MMVRVGVSPFEGGISMKARVGIEVLPRQGSALMILFGASAVNELVARRAVVFHAVLAPTRGEDSSSDEGWMGVRYSTYHH